MNKSWLITACLALVVSIASISGCYANSSNESDFNLIFKYGVTAKNELNTFKGTYTRDMVLDPPVTVRLSLTQDELDSIYRKIVEIDFFDYPDRFEVIPEYGELVKIITPYTKYYFKVEYKSVVKELWWDDEIKNENEKADKLRDLIKLIRDIIESKEEYKELPEPTSGYL